MTESSLNAALRHFEATEANLIKAEKRLANVNALIPGGVSFGGNPEYDDNCREFYSFFASLPNIDGWKPTIQLQDLDAIAQSRLDANEIDEIQILISLDRDIAEPERLLREYRYRFERKRRELVREALLKVINATDANLKVLSKDPNSRTSSGEAVWKPYLDELRQNIAEIGTLIGSSIAEPPRWTDLYRHLHVGTVGDLSEIVEHDWPVVKAGLRKSMYGENEPIPVEVEDLGLLVTSKPRGPVASRLKWESLTDDAFERLVFQLISSEATYENPELLMKTNAPDRGRDLSAYRVLSDPLGGVFRQRVIFQCKHWQGRSVGPADIALLREQMKLWEPPRIDIHIIATSGRFTSDAVQLVEKQNQSDSALRIEMWPESHLERLLASRPAIIAEFALR